MPPPQKVVIFLFFPFSDLVMLLEELGKASVVEAGEVPQLLQLNINLMELPPGILLLSLRQR